MDRPIPELTRTTLAVRCRAPTPDHLVADVHDLSAADDCTRCRWHLRLSLVGRELELQGASAHGVALPEALSRLLAVVPADEWRLVARGWVELRRFSDPPDERYVPYADLADLVLTAPPRRRLRELTGAGEPWGIAPSRLVAAHFGVSVATARRWLVAANRDQPAPASPS